MAKAKKAKKKAAKKVDYRTSLISFIDILGFREIVANRKCHEIEEILALVGAFSGGDDTGEGSQAKVVQFSDSIIRIRPLDSKMNQEYRYGALFHELTDIGMMQAALSDNNVFIRGGVTVGKIRYESGPIFGPGFIRAYDLESKFANYPRVVVDTRVLAALPSEPLLISEHNSVDDELGYISRCLACGSDGIQFVDYLRVGINNLDDMASGARPFMENHKRHILQNITSISELSSESVKYLWAARYHNSYLDGEIQRDSESEALWFTETDMPLLASLERFDK